MTVLLALADTHDRDDPRLGGHLRERLAADVVVLGHTHSPGVEAMDEVTVVNPGSHADSRGSRPAYAAVERTDGSLRVELRAPSGETVERTRLS
jgi:putative phosphoesterase